MNLTNGLIGYSLLTGSSALGAFGGTGLNFESRAVREAKAQFTLPETTAIWKSEELWKSPEVSAVRQLASFIDPPRTGVDELPADVQTSFTTYKALDRLRVLAEAAAKPTAPDGIRSSLQESFGHGLSELRDFLATAETESLDLAFARASRRAESVAIRDYGTATELPGVGVSAQRDDPLAGIAGNEVLEITLSKAGGISDTVTVDLSTAPQPPTLDGVADAVNAAIAAIPMLDETGAPALDENGDPVSRWYVSLDVEKQGDKWGLSLNRAGFETVSIDQVGAPDALMVAASRAAEGDPAQVQVMRFDDPAGTAIRRNLSVVSATDRNATTQAELLGVTEGEDSEEEGDGISAIAADLSANASITDADGSTYMLGTSSGDVGTSLSEGRDRLVLTKLDSAGRVLWHRALGSAGETSGAALSLGPGGDIVVAGTVEGAFDGDNADGDMMVARFGADGAEKYATVVRSVGADEANAVTVAADGSVVVGGRSANGDAFLAKLDQDGRLVQRHTIDTGGSERVRALATDAGGNILALTQEDGNGRLYRLDASDLSIETGNLDLGAMTVSTLVAGDSGQIAVGGRRISGAGDYDGVVQLVQPDFSQVRSVDIATAASDQVDSLTFLNGDLYVGGRTAGALGSEQQGEVDGFVARIDTAAGAVVSQQQFGRTALETEAVRVSAAPGGATILNSLGLRRGELTPSDSERLTAQTSLRAGDSFSLRIGDGPVRNIVIEAEDTLSDLAARIEAAARGRIEVTTPAVGDGRALRIQAKEGIDVELTSGPTGRDALGKLGLPAARLSVPTYPDKDEPQVRPGGVYGLDLSDALDLSTEEGAGLALSRIKSALSMTQSAYRSLYWSDLKATLVDGRSGGGGGVAAWNAKAASYQAALDRLSVGGSPSASLFGGF